MAAPKPTAKDLREAAARVQFLGAHVRRQTARFHALRIAHEGVMPEQLLPLVDQECLSIQQAMLQACTEPTDKVG